MHGYNNYRIQTKSKKNAHILVSKYNWPMVGDNFYAQVITSFQSFDCLYTDVKEIRGIGLQVSKLESIDTPKQGADYIQFVFNH